MKRSIVKTMAALTVGLLFNPAGAQAEYCAIGNIKGNVCSGFVIEACKFVQVDAVKGDDDKLYTVNRCYGSVSEYSESKGRCWIKTKSKGGGLLSWGVNAATQPEFFHLSENGDYEKLDVEYLTFKCQKR
jgi:hypothetical protein